MNTYLWLITAKTNLHVGDENDSNYGVIDKGVQRDVLTGLPCINSSSLKGAVKEYCTHNTTVDCLKIFGSDKNKNNSDTQKGKAIFYDAKLLYLPVQDDDNLFRYATCNEVKEGLKDRLAIFGKEYNGDLSACLAVGHKAESIECKEFNELCSDENLPIIARNVLDNGVSKNLWYEQVIPAETVFYTVIQEEGDELAKALSGKIIQIGANATIGYGYCKFTKIDL